MKATRGGMARARVSALATAAVLAACGGSSKVEQTPRGPVEVGSFIGEYSAASGTLTITPTGVDPIPMGLTYTGSFEEIPIEQDGNWPGVSADHVEMRTVPGTFHAYPGGCPGAGLFVADVQIHSGYAAHKLVRTYLEITSVPAGFESCLGVPVPSGSTITGAGGIFAYPDIDAGGYGTATWSFALPTQTDFRFVGKLWAEKVELTPPVTTASLGFGPYAAPQALSLTCADAGGSGCGSTYYTVNGGAQTGYTQPIRLSGSQHVCYWSVDQRGNAEAQHCGDFTVTADAATASWDSGLGVPRCSALASSCTTGTLVVGRRALPSAPEANTPNTLDGCQDGTAYDFAESLTSLTIATLDGGPLAPGKTVQVTADVNAADPADVFRVYWSSSTTAPSWQFLGTASTTGTGPQTVHVDFALPPRAVAIRGQLAFGGAVVACGVSGYDDQDDLVFVTDEASYGTSAPAVSITSPTGGEISKVVRVTANASDDIAVSSVAFKWRETAAAEWQTIATDYSPPWVVDFDTDATTYGANSAFIMAEATDFAGNLTTTAVSVTLRDLTPPVITITAPTDGVTLPRAANFPLSATVVDGRNGRDVYFLVDGTQVAHQTYLDEGSGRTYTFSFDPSTYATAYPHTVVVRATDWPGNLGQSAAVHFWLE